ncbi:protein of unknown function (plasmid) [Shinella sp. WSC3-e]|nr:protein of unknown function [Shinella sp. WSC3-e]
MNVEIYRHVRLILPGIGGDPSNMSHAMKLVYLGEADIAYPHLLGSYRSIVLIALRHELLELVVVLSGFHSGGRSTYKLGSIQRCELVHIDLAGEGPIEKALVSLEQSPYAGFHHLLSWRRP